MMQTDQMENTTVEEPAEKPAPKTKIKTLQDKIFDADQIQARRFGKLRGEALDIATEGIVRHFRACGRMDVNPDASALNGRKYF
jgi:hypothetical protein